MWRLALLLRVSLFTAILAVVLFGSAGRLDVPMFWAFLAVMLLSLAFFTLVIDRGLVEERLRPAGRSRDNLALLRWVMLLAFLSHWVLAGLDVGRWHLTDTVPLWVQVAGLIGITTTQGIWFWAMTVNRFFSSAVRIQHDRGHHVITGGPYRFVRHPGYAAFVTLGFSSGLALGSWLAVLPTVIWSLVFIRRAALEDRMLRNELEGYAEYARSVRYRLVPGVW